VDLKLHLQEQERLHLHLQRQLEERHHLHPQWRRRHLRLQERHRLHLHQGRLLLLLRLEHQRPHRRLARRARRARKAKAKEGKKEAAAVVVIYCPQFEALVEVARSSKRPSLLTSPDQCWRLLSPLDLRQAR